MMRHIIRKEILANLLSLRFTLALLMAVVDLMSREKT